MIAKYIILIILSSFIILAIKWFLKDPVKEKLYFLGFVILLFTLIYAISFLGYKIGGSAIAIEERYKEIKIAKNDVDNSRNEIEAIRKDLLAVRDGMKEVAKATAEIAILNFSRRDYAPLTEVEKTAKKDEIRGSLLSAMESLKVHDVDISEVEKIYHISEDK